MTNPPLVEVDHVTKTFGDRRALDDVTLTIARGELVGLLGPNGAGKSTLISLLTGLRRPSSGSVRVRGGDPRDPATRVALGSTPQQTGLPETLTVGEVTQFVARHYPEPADAEELLERFGLAELVGRQCGALSGGQQRRFAVALAMLGRPALVLLDEPTTGLDIDARHTLWDAIEAYQAEGGTVVVTSHYLEEIQRLAQRVVVIDRGRVLVDDTTRAVIDRVNVDRVSLASTDPRLAALPEVTSLDRDGEEITLLTPDADALVRRLVTEGIEFRRLRIAGASLEDAFAQLTSCSEGDRR